MQHKPHIPIEITASLLAACMILTTLPPLNLPDWAAFITWGATLLIGETSCKTIKRMWPPLILGTTAGALTFVVFAWSQIITGAGTGLSVFVDMLIIFVVAVGLLYSGHIHLFSLTPAIFLGFAVFTATAAGNFGPSPHTLLMFWIAATVMVCTGPVLAWMSSKLTLPYQEGRKDVHISERAWFPPTPPAELAPSKLSFDRDDHPVSLGDWVVIGEQTQDGTVRTLFDGIPWQMMHISVGNNKTEYVYGNRFRSITLTTAKPGQDRHWYIFKRVSPQDVPLYLRTAIPLQAAALYPLRKLNKKQILEKFADTREITCYAVLAQVKGNGPPQILTQEVMPLRLEWQAAAGRRKQVLRWIGPLYAQASGFVYWGGSEEQIDSSGTIIAPGGYMLSLYGE